MDILPLSKGSYSLGLHRIGRFPSGDSVGGQILNMYD